MVIRTKDISSVGANIMKGIKIIDFDKTQIITGEYPTFHIIKIDKTVG